MWVAQEGEFLATDPHGGISAIFEAYDGEERAIVLISFMQKQQRVTVPVSALNKP